MAPPSSHGSPIDATRDASTLRGMPYSKSHFTASLIGLWTIFSRSIPEARMGDTLTVHESPIRKHLLTKEKSVEDSDRFDALRQRRELWTAHDVPVRLFTIARPMPFFDRSKKYSVFNDDRIRDERHFLEQSALRGPLFDATHGVSTFEDWLTRNHASSLRLKDFKYRSLLFCHSLQH